MNTKLLRGVSLLATLALVVACNNNKKEITKDQEERLARVEADEKKNAETAKNLTNDISAFNEDKKKYETRMAELATQIADVERREAISKDADEKARLATEKEALVAEQEKAAATRQAQLEAQKQSLEASQRIFETDSEGYYNGLLARLARHENVGLIFTITSNNKADRDTLMHSVLNQSANANFKKHGNEINDAQNNLFASTELVILNDSKQLEAIKKTLKETVKTKLFFYEVSAGRVRSTLSINYADGFTFSQVLQEGVATPISDLSALNLNDPVTTGKFPGGCSSTLDTNCMKAISNLLDRKIRDNSNPNKEVSLKDILREEMKISRHNISVTGTLRSWAPATPHTFFGLVEGRKINSITISHELIFNGPKSGDERLKEVSEALLDRKNTLVDSVGIKSPVQINSSALYLSGLTWQDQMEKLSILGAALNNEI